MSRMDVDPSSSDDARAADGINPLAVLIALAVLVGLVAVIFYALPTWFGPTNVNVNIRG